MSELALPGWIARVPSTSPRGGRAVHRTEHAQYQ
jgi:hypothetical protein